MRCSTAAARDQRCSSTIISAWSLITKHRLAENIRALPPFEDVDVDTVAPPTYYVKDIGMLRELLSDFASRLRSACARRVALRRR